MSRNLIIAVVATLVAVVALAALYLAPPVPVVNAPSEPAPVDSPIVVTPSPSATTTPGTVQARPITFRVLDQGSHAAEVAVRRNVVARTPAEFTALWQLAHGADGVESPAVDFTKEFVIGVFAGTKNTGGHAISIREVFEVRREWTVGVRLTRPGEGCMVTQALTNPYQLVAVPVSDVTLVYKDTTVVRACD